MWTTYILRCSDNSLYTGITNDLSSRVATHAAGKGAKYTRSRLPVVLVYSEKLQGKSAALKREHEIKQLSKQEKEVLVAAATQHSR